MSKSPPSWVVQLRTATTGPDGRLSFAAVYEGEYDVRVDTNGCLAGQTLHVLINADTTLERSRQAQEPLATLASRLLLVHRRQHRVHDSSVAVALPFPFTFYGQAYSRPTFPPTGA